ncbi:MAG: hypothetical protein HQK78_15400 [Desulfobacterales bacterium]|nr:hypothetical protein [Desulfobacterales bacterium]
MSHKTLIGLKHLIETVEDSNATLAIIVMGHPKLGNDLRNPSMEEIGARAKVFNLNGIGNYKRQYIEWILDKCSNPDVKPYDIITKEAIELLSERLITPLQIAHYLTQALAKGYEAGLKPIDNDIIEMVLSPDINAIGPKLARQGYNIPVLCEYLNANCSDVRSYIQGKLSSNKTEDFNKEIQKIGLL